MKNLLFGLIATVLFAVNGNAQKMTKEDVRVQLAKGMADFTASLKPAYDKTKNLDDFKRTITGSWYPKITKEGNDLLNAAHNLLSRKVSYEEIVKNYNGKEIGIAALYINELSKKGVKTDGSELFGGTTGDFNPYVTTGRCRWYQFRCWMNEIFGEDFGQIIMEAVVALIKDLLLGL